MADTAITESTKIPVSLVITLSAALVAAAVYVVTLSTVTASHTTAIQEMKASSSSHEREDGAVFREILDRLARIETKLDAQKR